MVAMDDSFALPFLLAQQYVLTAVHRETRDSVLYTAMQKDTQRSVLVRSLRRRYADDAEAINCFIESARAASRLQWPAVSAVLEVFEIEGTWHLVCEGNGSDSLDFVALDGQKIEAADMVNLLSMLCRLCLYLDAENINTQPFCLNAIYRNSGDFVLDNPAADGKRDARVSNRYMIDAAQALLPLLAEDGKPYTALVRQCMQQVAEMPDTCSLIASDLLCDLTRLPDDAPAEDILL